MNLPEVRRAVSLGPSQNSTRQFLFLGMLPECRHPGPLPPWSSSGVVGDHDGQERVLRTTDLPERRCAPFNIPNTRRADQAEERSVSRSLSGYPSPSLTLLRIRHDRARQMNLPLLLNRLPPALRAGGPFRALPSSHEGHSSPG